MLDLCFAQMDKKSERNGNDGEKKIGGSDDSMDVDSGSSKGQKKRKQDTTQLVETVLEIKEELDVDRESEEIEEKKIELSREILLEGTAAGDWDAFLEQNEMERDVLTALCAATDKGAFSKSFWAFVAPQGTGAPRKARSKPKSKSQEEDNTAHKRSLSFRFVTRVGDKALRLGASICWCVRACLFVWLTHFPPHP
jgi:hypothetical protein